MFKKLVEQNYLHNLFTRERINKTSLEVASNRMEDESTIGKVSQRSDQFIVYIYIYHTHNFSSVKTGSKMPLFGL